MKATKSIILKNQISEIAQLPRILEQFGGHQNVPETVLSSMNLALEEIITNIISYGYKDQQEHEIILRLFLESNELVAEVEDDGQPFNPLDVPDPDTNLSLEDRSIGGLGIHLTKMMMDGLEYTQWKGKNLLRLRKGLSE